MCYCVNIRCLRAIPRDQQDPEAFGLCHYCKGYFAAHKVCLGCEQKRQSGKPFVLGLCPHCAAISLDKNGNPK
jgi:hypothetical protein